MFAKRFFGNTKDGRSVDLFECENRQGMRVEILSYGGIIRSLQVPDASGQLRDVVLGYDTLDSYERQDKYLGALIGRFGNRIGGSRFALGGKEYTVSANEGVNCLHGGLSGFDKKVWEPHMNGNSLELTYVSADGEEGFPGNLTVTVTYTLTDDSELLIDYRARSDKDTPVNLTNHSYFNLNGHDSGSMENHRLRIVASQMTPVRSDLIPTGEKRSVAGTPFDFLDFHTVGERIAVEDDQLRIGGGYDHNYLIDGSGMRLAAELIGDDSGIKMETFTDMEAVQVYSGNFIAGVPTGKAGIRYGDRGAICLETQFCPDSVNCPAFSSPVLPAGEEYHHQTIYRFQTI